MSKYLFRLAEDSDSEALVKLFGSTPQKGQVVVNFEREPNYFIGNKVITPDTLVVVCIEKESDEIVGCSSMGARQVYVNGEIKKIRYAADLRICAKHRNGRILVGLYREAKKYLSDDEWTQTAILKENDYSIATITKSRASLPNYLPYGDLTSYLLYIPPSPRKSADERYVIRPASHFDIPQLQSFFDENAPKRQFYPVYDFAKIVSGDDYYSGLSLADFMLCFNEDGKLKGVAGSWDQKSFKQTRIISYPGITKYLRHLFNLYSLVRGGLTLPKAGGALNYCMLHSVLIDNDDPGVFRALLENIIVQLKQSGYEGLMVGSINNDPYVSILESYRHRKTYTNHYIASYNEHDPRETLDTRPLYLEVARL
ncbi:MAG: hypothetical protein MI867_03305 [Pseudomonadales bacterium]|nr:hypothetical protein [Pseudomonadales bacterium]